MHLKILLVPSMIIIALVLAIGYIEPDFQAMQEKRVQMQAKKEQASNMETLLSNIDALASSLDTQKDSENFVTSYLPRTIDQGRVIDALNYTALQSGVSISHVDIAEPSEQDSIPTVTDASGAEVPQMIPALGPDGVPLLNPDGTAVMTQGGPTIHTYTASVTVKGSYENIKNFFIKVSHMNRYFQTKSISVGISKEDLNNSSLDLNNIEGNFTADFDYIALQKAQSALNKEVFKSSQLDLGPLQNVFSWVTQQVPVLEKPTTGKANPFQ